jgi:Domain of unknown function (DUF4440)
MNIEKDLTDLNVKSVALEQAGGTEAHAFFEALLSDQLIFRRASGKVVGKTGDEGFLKGLNNNPFKSREAEDVVVNVLDQRALVTLIVVATRKDDGSVHRFRNIRVFSRLQDHWILEVWYNYEITGL